MSAMTPGPNQWSNGISPMARPAAWKCFSPSMWVARWKLARQWALLRPKPNCWPPTRLVYFRLSGS